MTRRTRASRDAENRLAALESEISGCGERPLGEDEQKAILDELADLRDRDGERCAPEQEH